jgi:hypothetical protein
MDYTEPEEELDDVYLNGLETHRKISSEIFVSGNFLFISFDYGLNIFCLKYLNDNIKSFTSESKGFFGLLTDQNSVFIFNFIQ